VIAFLDDFALIYYDDFAGMPNGRQAVRNNDADSIFQEHPEALLNSSLGNGVDG
jgi:hypothetical protein